MGFHFLDNYSSAIVPLSEFEEFPRWVTDAKTGAVSYRFTTREGLEFGGRAVPSADEVELEFYVANNTGQVLEFVRPAGEKGVVA